MEEKGSVALANRTSVATNRGNRAGNGEQKITGGNAEDEEDEDRELWCAICLSLLRKPRQLPCGHAYCLHCLVQLAVSSSRRLQCPSCRGQCLLPPEGVEGLPVDAKLLEQVQDQRERRRERKRENKKQCCSKCSVLSLCTCCPHCKQQLCTHCVLQHLAVLRADVDSMTSTLETLKKELQVENNQDSNSAFISRLARTKSMSRNSTNSRIAAAAGVGGVTSANEEEEMRGSKDTRRVLYTLKRALTSSKSMASAGDGDTGSAAAVGGGGNGQLGRYAAVDSVTYLQMERLTQQRVFLQRVMVSLQPRLTQSSTGATSLQDSSTRDTRSRDSRSRDSRSRDSRSRDSRSRDSRSRDSRSLDSRSRDSRSRDSRSRDSRSRDSRSRDSMSSDSRSRDSRSRDSMSSDSRSRDSRTRDSRSPDRSSTTRQTFQERDGELGERTLEEKLDEPTTIESSGTIQENEQHGNFDDYYMEDATRNGCRSVSDNTNTCRPCDNHPYDTLLFKDKSNLPRKLTSHYNDSIRSKTSSLNLLHSQDISQNRADLHPNSSDESFHVTLNTKEPSLDALNSSCLTTPETAEGGSSRSDIKRTQLSRSGSQSRNSKQKPTNRSPTRVVMPCVVGLNMNEPSPTAKNNPSHDADNNYDEEGNEMVSSGVINSGEVIDNDSDEVISSSSSDEGDEDGKANVKHIRFAEEGDASLDLKRLISSTLATPIDHEQNLENNSLLYRCKPSRSQQRLRHRSSLRRPTDVAWCHWNNVIYVTASRYAKVIMFPGSEVCRRYSYKEPLIGGLSPDGDSGGVEVLPSEGSRPCARHSSTWGVRGNDPGQLLCPSAVVCSPVVQELYVLDKWRCRVVVFTLGGRFLREWGAKGDRPGHMRGPEAIAVDGGGLLYLADTCNDRIQVLDRHGRFRLQFGSEELREPAGVAVSQDGGTVLVADTSHHRCRVYSGSTGQLLQTFGGRGSNQGQMEAPECVALDPCGFMLVGDSGNKRLQIFRPNGNFVRYLGSRSGQEGELELVTGIAVSPALEVIAVDFAQHAVIIY